MFPVVCMCMICVYVYLPHFKIYSLIDGYLVLLYMLVTTDRVDKGNLQISLEAC